jgi:hypothetical protein
MMRSPAVVVAAGSGAAADFMAAACAEPIFGAAPFMPDGSKAVAATALLVVRVPATR